LLFGSSVTAFSEEDLWVQQKQLTSKKPSFVLTLPSELRLVHSSSFEYPGQHSLTRTYFLIKERKKQVEELLVVQIADRTNPNSGPITVSLLKPYTEKRMYVKDKMTKGDWTTDYMIQLMAWNPEASSLQPIAKKGIVIPQYWALQGQFLFVYGFDHAVLVRYSKDIRSFGLKVSEEGKKWERGAISGNERKVYEAFRKIFVNMMGSVDVKLPGYGRQLPRKKTS
jgi:hypothetical protein